MNDDKSPTEQMYTLSLCELTPPSTKDTAASGDVPPVFGGFLNDVDVFDAEAGGGVVGSS